MLTNHLPKVRGDDPATWRRIMAVPFDQIVPEDQRDGRLPERLKAAPDAIMAWLWAGWLDYQRTGLNAPVAVLAATKQYQLDSDTITRFIDDDSTVCDGHGTVGSADLYQAFKGWCRDQGEPTEMTQKAFTEALDARGYSRKKTNRGAQWQGLSLVPDEAGPFPWGSPS
jgi:putative DNA primase/helicase